jgi:hypothetical protein
VALGGEIIFTRSVVCDPCFGVGYAFVLCARVGLVDGFSVVGCFELGVLFGDGVVFVGVGAVTYVLSIIGEL